MWMSAEIPSASTEGIPHNLIDLSPLSPIFPACICCRGWIYTQWRIILIMAIAVIDLKAAFPVGLVLVTRTWLVHSSIMAVFSVQRPIYVFLKLYSYTSLHQIHKAAAKFTMACIASRSRRLSVCGFKKQKSYWWHRVELFLPKGC